VQLIENEDDRKIIHFQVELESRKVDLTIFKETPLKIAHKAKVKADCGYQGIKKIHINSQTPAKKSKNGELTKKNSVKKVLA